MTRPNPLIRPENFTEAQYQHALTLLAKVRLRPFANPHLAAVVQEFVSSDLRDLSNDSQRRAGYRPGALPASPTGLGSQPMIKAAEKRHAVLCKKITKLLADDSRRTTGEIARAIGSDVDLVRTVAQSLIASGVCGRTETRPNRYFLTTKQEPKR